MSTTETIADDHHAATATAPEAAMQAVVLIHGMGEQIPMDTIKGFVRTVWSLDPVITKNGLPSPTAVWSKPDERTGSLELRRITTRESIASDAFPTGVRTDFYELYWADLSAGSTWDQLAGWIKHLLFRPWARVPGDVRGVWILLWVATIAVIILGGLGLVPEPAWKAHTPKWLDQKLVVALFAAGAAMLHYAGTRTFGRVVRYTRAEPDNIAARAAIRARGLALLRALHDHNLYQRIVVVGHSLGAILAYDLLSYFWAERVQARTFEEGSPAFAALCEVEAAARRLDRDPHDPTKRDAFFDTQKKLRRLVAARQASDDDPTGSWRISDLVTLGSPLAHAEFLLAQSRRDLEMRQQARELPASPPYREALDPKGLDAARESGAFPIDSGEEHARLMAYPNVIGSKRWSLHHAAPFALVRWTNVFDKARLIALGDFIGGPTKPQFGPGVIDVDLSQVDRPSWRFTHTRYWAADQPIARIEALRRAVNLLDQ